MIKYKCLLGWSYPFDDSDDIDKIVVGRVNLFAIN